MPRKKKIALLGFLCTALALSTAAHAQALRGSPLSLTFNIRAVGTGSAVQTVTLTNPGPDSLSIQDISLADDGHARDFELSGTPDACQELRAGREVSFGIRYVPRAEGPYATTVIVTYANRDPQIQHLTLPITIHAPQGPIRIQNHIPKASDFKVPDPIRFFLPPQEAPPSTLMCTYLRQSDEGEYCSGGGQVPLNRADRIPHYDFRPVRLTQRSHVNICLGAAIGAEAVVLLRSSLEAVNEHFQLVHVNGDGREIPMEDVRWPLTTNRGGRDQLEIHLRLIYRPQSLGEHATGVVIRSNDDDFPNFTIPVTASAIEPLPPDLVTSRRSLRFNEQYPRTSPGTSRELTFTLSNQGEADLNVRALALSDPQMPFTIIPPAEVPVTIPRGGRSDVTVRFNPQEVGNYGTDLAITSNDPDTPVLSIPVSGTSQVWSNLVMDSSRIDFEHRTVGTDSDIVWIPIRNTGPGPLTLNITLAPPPAGVRDSRAEYQLYDLPAQIEANGEISFGISYNPRNAGVHYTTISITSDSAANPNRSFRVTGSAENAPQNP